MSSSLVCHCKHTSAHALASANSEMYFCSESHTTRENPPLRAKSPLATFHLVAEDFSFCIPNPAFPSAVALQVSAPISLRPITAFESTNKSRDLAAPRKRRHPLRNSSALMTPSP